MGKIGLIIQREYLTKVKKKSFIILTLLGPVLWAGILLLPPLLNEVGDTTKDVYIVDETHLLSDIFKNQNRIRFHSEFKDLPNAEVVSMFKDSDNAFVLFIPRNVYDARKVNLISRKHANSILTSYLGITLTSAISSDLLIKNKIDQSVVDEYSKPVNVDPIVDNKRVKDDDKKSILGVGLAVFIYFFVFLYSVQVMRGVMEEKSSRIVEVIISSVKPFQLMMGKILGIALVGLTQFLLWIILSVAVSTPISHMVLQQKADESNAKELKIGVPVNAQHADRKAFEMQGGITEFLGDVNWPLVLVCFAFYFLMGYLLYSSLFAAVGSAVDAESDTQQFMLPITIPLILSMTMSGTILSNPDGPVAFWMSMIPLTSPIVMMMRIPATHVMLWELLLSMTLLVSFFILMTWVAGRIYRTGILMYGKKVSWKELGKWLFYKG